MDESSDSTNKPLGLKTVNLLRGAAEIPTALFSGLTSDGPQLPPEPTSNESQETIADYVLLEQIGVGGMGIVYRATQRSTSRTVALKIVRPDLLERLSPEKQQHAIDRFRQEAHAAAQIDHPNIVTIYDVGEANGSYFISMQYVQGRDLAECIRNRPLEETASAGYIEPIARAVHEAHEQGILHRDLKPQNILIDSKTDQPLVADFGLAKLMQNESSMTREGDVIGTPQYMSPEQTCDTASLTTSSDVYSLGATLYHLVTGRPPFQAATILETMRQVLMDIPVAPRQLNAAIHRDLETICLKCLEKDPSRRYASALDLADELARFQNNEPIVARRPSAPERLWRWCRRNRLAAALSTSTLVFLLAALVATSIGYVKTSIANRKSAESLRQARNAVSDFFTRVSEDDLLNQPGMQPLRRDLLEQARLYHLQFLETRQSDPSIALDLAESHFLIGRITEEIEGPRQALASFRSGRDILMSLLSGNQDPTRTREELGNTMNAFARCLFYLDMLDESRQAFQEAIRYRGQLVSGAATNSEYQRKLANTRMNLGLVRQESGHWLAAHEQFAAAQKLREGILSQQPNNPQVLRDLAMGHHNMSLLWSDADELVKAEKEARLAVESFQKLLKESPHDLSNRHLLGVAYVSLGDLAELIPSALEAYGAAATLIGQLAEENPTVDRYRSNWAEVRLATAQLEIELHDWSLAMENLDAAESLLKQLCRDAPSSKKYPRDLAVTFCKKAHVFQAQEMWDDAKRSVQMARDFLTPLIGEFPQNADYIEQWTTIEQLSADLEIDGKAGADFR